MVARQVIDLQTEGKPERSRHLLPYQILATSKLGSGVGALGLGGKLPVGCAGVGRVRAGAAGAGAGWGHAANMGKHSRQKSQVSELKYRPPRAVDREFLRVGLEGPPTARGHSAGAAAGPQAAAGATAAAAGATF